MPPSPVTTRGPSGLEYEYRVLTFPREVSRAEIRRALGEHAEYDHWELARTVVYVGGSAARGCAGGSSGFAGRPDAADSQPVGVATPIGSAVTTRLSG